MLRVLKGVGFRAFYRWLTRNHADLFPTLPDRTRLLRLLRRHCHLADAFLCRPGKRGLLDTFGIEMIHPKREGRSDEQHGKKGLSNHRWIVGIKFCPLLTTSGSIVDWDFDTANVHDSQFLYLVERNQTTKWNSDMGFRRSVERGGIPSNLTLCERGACNERMVVETVFSLWQGVLHLKKTTTRAEHHLEALLAFAVAAYNILVNWTGKTKLATTFFSI